MNYTMIIKELESASSFELFRLKIAIENELERAERIRDIKKRIKIGMKVSYFDDVTNNLVDAVIIDIRRTKLSVKNDIDGKIWDMSFHYLNLDKSNVDIETSNKVGSLTKNQLKVGQMIGFIDRNNNDLYGKIIKLNPKTVKIMVGDQKWTVSYSFLFPIIDVEKNKQGSIEILR